MRYVIKLSNPSTKYNKKCIIFSGEGTKKMAQRLEKHGRWWTHSTDYLPPKSEDFRIVFRGGAPLVPDRFTIDDVTRLLRRELSPELPADKRSKRKVCVLFGGWGLY